MSTYSTIIMLSPAPRSRPNHADITPRLRQRRARHGPGLAVGHGIAAEGEEADGREEGRVGGEDPEETGDIAARAMGIVRGPMQ